MDALSTVPTERTEKTEIIDLPYIIKLSKPLKFEGKEYTTIDLKDLENTSTEDLLEVQRMMERGGFISTIPEMTTAFACYLCSIATNLPFEFFMQLTARDMIKVRGAVTSFLFAED